jgi:alkaline phosphatase D
MFTRRAFVKTLAAVAISTRAWAQPRFASYPFTLGVASGYPTATSVVLWTRLMEVLAPTAVPVRWEIFGDEALRTLVAAGDTLADPAWAHSVHLEAQGLQPGRWYWYRFSAGDAQSPVGRTRTAPASDHAGPLRFAFASCQQYEQGYYGAYRHVVADAPDLVAFLGDYIYESSWGRELVRSHASPEPYTLEGYRARHALYRSDADLQAAHAACPWIMTWDDHEVDNDYADDRPEDGMPREAFLERRAAAYRAYYEHMPLPARMQPQGPNMRIYTHLDWGTAARFHVLDDRQYRSWHACPRPGRRGGSNTLDVERCPRLATPGRSMLGRAQERWLERELAASPARWNVLAQQTRMAQFDELPGEGRRAWTDAWDGYPAARTRLLEQLRKVRNPLVIGGDIHAFNVSNLKADFDDPASPVVASEIVATSITSQGFAQERIAPFMADNPHVLYADTRYRGYVRVNVTDKLLQADLRAMESVTTRDAACSTLATFVVEDGKPGPQRAA